jgi:dinuclear metal center YbgI/SA1388 family protein
MKLSDLSGFLDSAIPLSFQESYDNSGLQVGDPKKEITSALLAIDVTDAVLDEAEAAGCELIISHHPLIFGGLKRLTGRSYTERLVAKAISSGVAVYSAHTNLDVSAFGVSRKMADMLGLKNISPLIPLNDKLLKLVTYIPAAYLDKVREAVFAAGAGVIGNYDQCGFTADGTGSFRPGEGTNPFSGEKGKLNLEKEVRFETILYSHLQHQVLTALLDAHPYEEVAYDIYRLGNETLSEGMGCIGETVAATDEMDFLRLVASVFGSRGLRYSALTGKQVRKVALCGGAGSSLTRNAIDAGADVFVTGDIKYHSFFDAEERILLADPGHYESEKFTTGILYDLIIKKFPKFAVRFSGTNTNPINYL